MIRFALCFGLGTLLFHQLPYLPGRVWLIPQGLGLLLLVTLLVFSKRQRLRSARLPVQVGLPLLLGSCWSHAYSLHAAPPHLDLDQPRADVTLIGTIVDLPQINTQLTRFIVETTVLKIGSESIRGNWRLRLSWRDAPVLRPGDRWDVQARIRAVHGYASPGAWDYEGWLYHQGIRYTGYVTAGQAVASDTGIACCLFDTYRDALRRSIGDLPLSPFAEGVVRALVVADRSGLDAPARLVFRDTGTSHLMAVSGLHIGLVSGAVMFLIGSIWRRIPRLSEWLPARIAATGFGFAAAGFYAALAGFGLPTQRALIMFAVLAAGILLRRQTRVGHSLAVAACLVLLWHPPSIVDAGFWLSFGAVAAIVATLAWTRSRPLWFKAVAIQLGVTVGLWPLLLVFGLPVSALAPLINLLLVPLFGVLIVPWSLLGGLLALPAPSLAALGVEPLGVVLDYLQGLLASAAALALNLPAGTGTGIMAVGLFVALMLLPPGIPLRWVALPLLVLPWLPRQPLVENGDFHLHLLDVGQGLSVVIETRRHVLVYDTGPAYQTGFSTAEAVVLPFLRHRGRPSVDRLVASHGDSDHAGGTTTLMQAISVADFVSGEPERIGGGARACLAGDSWQWDGVEFEILHPTEIGEFSGNNASCVLRVANAAGAVLLTGDIEASIEHRLLRRQPERLAADVVVAPHHGSLSSSSEALVNHSGATHVLFARGWANRYGFPRAEITARWANAGSLIHDTALAGTLSFAFQSDAGLLGPVAYRRASKRYWMHDVGSAKPSHAVSFDD